MSNRIESGSRGAYDEASYRRGSRPRIRSLGYPGRRPFVERGHPDTQHTRPDGALLESQRPPTLARGLADKIGKIGRAADYTLRNDMVLVPLQLGLIFSASLLAAQAEVSTSMTAAERLLNLEMALGAVVLSISVGVLGICTMGGGDRKK